MTVKPEETFDEEEVLLDDDVEALRKKLLELSEQGEIKTTKAFLSNKKKATEKVMKKIMSEYVAQKERVAKMEMSIALVSLLPILVEKLGVIKFKDGSAVFSQTILEDENSMFCIADLIPSCQGGDCYFKYLSATVFLSTLVWNNVSLEVMRKKRKQNLGNQNTLRSTKKKFIAQEKGVKPDQSEINRNGSYNGRLTVCCCGIQWSWILISSS